MKTTSKTAVAAFSIAIASIASQAQAHTLLRFHPKSAVPYAVPHIHSGGGYSVQNASECPRTVIKRSFRGKVTLVCPDR